MRLLTVRVLQRSATKKWTPRIQERYPHGSGVIRYLARYVRGGPFRNQSLLSCDEHHVTFTYKNWRHRDSDGRPTPDVLTLSIDEFLSRLLTHVPQPHTRTVRGWGLYAHSGHAQLELARTLLPEPTEPEPAAERQQPAHQSHALYCPVCGQRLLVRQLDLRGKPPPQTMPVHG